MFGTADSEGLCIDDIVVSPPSSLGAGEGSTVGWILESLGFGMLGVLDFDLV